jgi:CRISPR-associated protein Cmr2
MESTMPDWRLKIFAYLHDPPDKPFALGRGQGHAAWGRELAKRLAGDPDPRWDDLIKRADWLASGADRSAMLPEQRATLDDLRHPLSGMGIDLSRYGEIGPEAREGARAALDEEFEHLAAVGDDPAAAFVALWGLLPHRLRRRRGRHELGALWDLLPAETRMPNHPISAHQSLVSALAAVLHAEEEAALLGFSIGPVQSFIAQARRTSDLWGGSALLSRALLEAVGPVVEEAGPDHIVFPALRRSAPFLDWLLSESPWAARLSGLDTKPREGASRGALPNRFLAVLPISTANGLARRCEERVRAWWEEEASTAARELEGQEAGLAGFADLAREQVRAFLTVTWAVTPWPLATRIHDGAADDACRRAAWARGGVLPPTTRGFIERGSRPRQEQTVRAFAPNGGALYGACYDAADTLVSSVKRTRPVTTRREDGLKCSLCGERGVVPGPATFREQARVWARVRARLAERGALRRGEGLCGVCWTKRRIGFEEKRVPSTAEVAASPFKRRVLDHLGLLDHEVTRLCDAVERAGRWGHAYVVPDLLSFKERGGLAARFASVEGELLLAHPREDRAPDDEEEIAAEVLRATAELRRAAANKCGIVPARPYLAVLVMDGDEMGRWLSGEKQLQLREYLSGRARGELEAAGAGSYLSMTWPMTPALHAAFSEACAVFSQGTAPRTLHEDGLPGFLVYAGGDDVLAFTPVGCHDPAHRVEISTEIALRLRLRFSGHVRRDGGRDVIDPTSDAGWVLSPSEGLSLAFGHYVTASAGLAVFHHRWPLGRALAEARNAEHFAKEGLGRDALAISILRRSGQVTRTGLRFGTDRMAIRSLQTLCHAFAFDRLSPRFLGEIRKQLAGFRGGLEAGRLMALAAPLVGQAVGDHFQGDQEEDLAALRTALNDLAAAAVAPPGAGVSDDNTDRRRQDDRKRLERWLDLIEAAVFLGRGEEP